MRAPFQVLVVPFRRTADGPEFAVLKRSDADYWQFIAGGGEDAELPVRAAERETQEEVGITGEMLHLDSLSMVPKDCFAAADSWGPDVYVIPEHCFAVNVGGSALSLSNEHTESQWVSYEQASRLLKWDSNRNALWELNERLKTPNKPDARNGLKPRVIRGVPPDPLRVSGGIRRSLRSLACSPVALRAPWNQAASPTFPLPLREQARYSPA